MEAAESFEDNKSEDDQNRGTQRENFTIGVGTPFYVISRELKDVRAKIFQSIDFSKIFTEDG